MIWIQAMNSFDVCATLPSFHQQSYRVIKLIQSIPDQIKKEYFQIEQISYKDQCQENFRYNWNNYHMGRTYYHTEYEEVIKAQTGIIL